MGSKKSSRRSAALVVEYEVRSVIEDVLTLERLFGVSDLPTEYKAVVTFAPRLLRIDLPFGKGVSIFRDSAGRRAVVRNHEGRILHSHAAKPSTLTRTSPPTLRNHTRIVRAQGKDVIQEMQVVRHILESPDLSGEMWLATESRSLSASAGEFVGLLLGEERHADVVGVPLRASVRFLASEQSRVEFTAVQVREARADSIETANESFREAPPDAEQATPPPSWKVSRREPAPRIRGVLGQGPGQSQDHPSGEDFAILFHRPLLDAIKRIVNALFAHLPTYQGDGADGRAPAHVEVDLWRDLVAHMTLANPPGGSSAPEQMSTTAGEADAVLLEALKRGLTALFFLDWQIRDLLTPTEQLLQDYATAVIGAHDRRTPMPPPPPSLANVTIGPDAVNVALWATTAVDALEEWNLDSKVPLGVRAYLMCSGSDRLLNLLFPDVRPQSVAGLPPIPAAIPAERMIELEEVGSPRTLQFDLRSDLYEYSEPKIKNIIGFRVHDFDTSITLGSPFIDELIPSALAGGARAAIQIANLYCDFYWSTWPADTWQAKALAAGSLGGASVLLTASGWGYFNVDDAKIVAHIHAQPRDYAFHGTVLQDESSLDLSYNILRGSKGDFFDPSLSQRVFDALALGVLSVLNVFRGKVLDGVQKLLNESALPKLGRWVDIWQTRNGPPGERARSHSDAYTIALIGQLTRSDPLWQERARTELTPRPRGAAAYAVSKEYLTSWMNRYLGGLRGEVQLASLDIERRVRDLVPGFALPEVKSLPVPAECDAEVQEFDASQSRRNLDVLFNSDWRLRSVPETVPFAELDGPPARANEYLVRTTLFRSQPEVVFTGTGRSDLVGQVSMSYRVLVEAIRIAHRSWLGGITPGRCHLMRQQDFDALLTLEHTGRASGGGPTERVIARGFREGEFEMHQLPAGILGLTSPELAAFGAPPPGPGLPDQPRPPQFGGLPDPNQLPVMVCEPPRALWLDRDFECKLRTFLDARCDVRSDLKFGFEAGERFPSMSSWQWLPRVAWGAGPQAGAVATIDATGAPVDQVPAIHLTTVVQELCLADFQSVLGAFLAQGGTVHQYKMPLAEEIVLGLVVESTINGNLTNGAPLYVLYRIAKLLNLGSISDRPYEVQGRFLYWHLKADEQVSALFPTQ